MDTEEELVSITNLEPKFMIQEPSYDNYKFVIIAFNDKGESQVVEVNKDSIVSEEIGEYSYSRDKWNKYSRL